MQDKSASNSLKPDMSNSGPLRHLSLKLRSDLAKKESGFSKAYRDTDTDPSDQLSRSAWNHSFPTMVYARLAAALEAGGQTVSSGAKPFLEASDESRLADVCLRFPSRRPPLTWQKP